VAKDQNDNLPKTNERLAAEYNVSPATCTQTKPATSVASGTTGRSRIEARQSEIRTA